MLKDASHLTWRRLPVSVEIRTGVEVEEAVALVSTALDRVTDGNHDVNRDPEYFYKLRIEQKVSAVSGN